MMMGEAKGAVTPMNDASSLSMRCREWVLSVRDCLSISGSLTINSQDLFCFVEVQICARINESVCARSSGLFAASFLCKWNIC